MVSRKFQCDLSTTVSLHDGKLRGYRLEDVYIFQGIQYATAGRFMPPEPIEPWTGIKDALAYGYVAPLLKHYPPDGEHMIPHRYWPEAEECLYLNIWTRSLDESARKPVMVWLHGGGFFAGSSIEQVAYDGENLCRRKDVVVVSLNHRLNILGYMDLSFYGEKYKHSANVGNEDMVAALQWIHKNIEKFGGDPDNVTLFGQSGGGMKVICLMQTPAADGLFHKGIIQSGVIKKYGQPSKTDPRPLVKVLLQELGDDAMKPETLEHVPYNLLFKAYNKVEPALSRQGEYVGGFPIKNEFYKGVPWEFGFRKQSEDIPLLIGSVFGEYAFAPGVENKDTLDELQIKRILEKKYGQKTCDLIPLFQGAYPDKNLCDLLVLDSLFRIPNIEFIHKRLEVSNAPVYSYIFAYDFLLEGGKPAWHCSEIPFVFGNTDKIAVCNDGDISERLEDQMSSAWAAFARTGEPQCKSLPKWSRCTLEDEATMIFDRCCCVRHNFDHLLMHRLSGH